MVVFILDILDSTKVRHVVMTWMMVSLPLLTLRALCYALRGRKQNPM
jgi:hypothetical protein